MKSPDSPPPNPSTTNNDEDHANKQAAADETIKISLTNPLRTHPKRLLPPMFSSTYPHGHISGFPRTPEQQIAFDARRAEILRTMSAVEIERAYEDVAAKVRRETDEAERTGREVEEKMERLRMEREMERRVWGKLRGMKGGE